MDVFSAWALLVPDFNNYNKISFGIAFKSSSSSFATMCREARADKVKKIVVSLVPNLLFERR